MLSPSHAAWHLARILAGCPVDTTVTLKDAPQPYQAVLGHLLTRGETPALEAFQQALLRLPLDLAQDIEARVRRQDVREAPTSDDDGDAQEAVGDASASMPALPREAVLEGEWQTVLKDHWLTEYCRFAGHAAPMTPIELHTLLGLGMLSTGIARRVIVQRGTVSLHANLYGLFVAPSTLHHKSTGFAVGQKVLAEAGLKQLLLPEMQTPESLVIELGVQPPPTFGQWPKDTQVAWRAERLFAAQRSLWLDEASRLFDSFSRDYTAALRTLVLQLYECPDRETFQTVSRGRQTVTQAYLTVLGATTPASIKTLLQRDACWSEGLWPRFALVTPRGGLPDFKFLPSAAVMPSRLVDSLRSLALERLQQPAMTMTESGITVEPIPPHVAEVEPEAMAHWEAYAKALGHTLLAQGSVDEQLFASYGRLPMMAMKVALNLATMDWVEAGAGSGAPRVSATHWRAAQLLTEEWRASLHRLVSLTQITAEERLQDRILQKVGSMASAGITLRDLQRQLHRRREELERVVKGLIKDSLLSEGVTLHANNTRTVRYVRSFDINKGTATPKQA